jgi:hypothetical protein
VAGREFAFFGLKKNQMPGFSFNEISLKSIILILVTALIVFYFLGFAIKRWLLKKELAKTDAGLGALEGALLSLFGLFMAFSFGMAADRFNARRDAVINEANAISTAVLRADLYPDSVRLILRSQFKEYLDARLLYHDVGNNTDSIKIALGKSNDAGLALWKTIGACAQDPQFFEPNRLMVPAMNEMIDAVTTRDAALNATVPASIIWVLMILSVCSSFIVGYGSKGENVNYVIGSIFVIMISVSLTLIIDLDRPRNGLITNAQANEKMVELKQMFE